MLPLGAVETRAGVGPFPAWGGVKPEVSLPWLRWVGGGVGCAQPVPFFSRSGESPATVPLGHGDCLPGRVMASDGVSRRNGGHHGERHSRDNGSEPLLRGRGDHHAFLRSGGFG